MSDVGLVDTVVKGTDVVPACTQLPTAGEMSSRGRRFLAQTRNMEAVRKLSTARRETLARETLTKLKSFPI